MSLIIPFSEACERNKDPILDTIAPYLRDAKHALEIGTGTAQHVIHFAAASPNVQWQPSDQKHNLDGIIAQLRTRPTTNILAPVELDVTRQPWFEDQRKFDLIYTANTLHIMSWPVVESLFDGLSSAITSLTKVIIYGPFKFAGKHTSPSNAAFDESLRSRGVGSGIRDFEAVDQLATNAGLELVATEPMPANNFCIIWRAKVGQTA